MSNEGRVTSNEKMDLFEQAKKIMPGGVNSPVRSFKAVGCEPLFIKRANGSKIYGGMSAPYNNCYIDYINSWGALILGHSHPEVVEEVQSAVSSGTSFGLNSPYELELAQIIVQAIPSIEMIRLTNSGTEAVMGAVRLARSYSGKTKIIKFEGCYHGHADYLLVKAGSGSATFGNTLGADIPPSDGVPADFVKHTIVLKYNDTKSVERVISKYADELAAVIIEPVAGNMGVVLPDEAFLKSIRAACDRHNVLLIFDEVITGFRLLFGGAQKLFDVKPDLTCLGKIIGGGFPVGAFGGRRDIMIRLSPLGNTYQAGTLSGNPVAVRAGIKTLKILRDENPYKKLKNLTAQLTGGIKKATCKYSVKIKVNSVGSMFSIYFTDKEVKNYSDAAGSSSVLFKKFYQGLLKGSICFAPSYFESNFISTAHTAEDIEKTLKVIEKIFNA